MNYDSDRRLLPFRTWAEIDLDHLRHNYRLIAKAVPAAQIMPVIKADGYGHGAVPLARALAREGAACFGVATAQEALELREAGVKLPILILGPVPPAVIPRLVAGGITVAVCTEEMARQYSAHTGGGAVEVHVQLDTGMCRYGIPVRGDGEGVAAAVSRIASLPGICVRGVFSHFAVSDTPGEDNFTAGQAAGLRAVLQALEERGISLTAHSCNSAAAMRFPPLQLDLVRVGILLYGILPDQDCPIAGDFRQVMSLRTRVMQVKTIEPGDTVGYGRAFCARESRTVATVPVGYADGLMRAGSNKLEFLVAGCRALQIGRICMDSCMIDVTGIPGVAVGSTVTLMGQDGNEGVTAQEIAQRSGTIPYETVCAVSRRVPRVYVEGGGIVHILERL